MSQPAPTRKRAVLIDTHIWVWLVDGARDQIDAEAVTEVERAAIDGRLFVSVISVWEIGMLEAAGRIRLSTDVHTWIARARRPPGPRIAQLSPTVALESTRLPGDIHRDPADRIIVATARQLPAVLVTRDRRLVEYGAAGHAAVLDAAP
jgi:PIN domain nuclease of toxin-antitoxin system